MRAIAAASAAWRRAHAIERGGQPRAVHRLQQVIERRELEGIDRVLIERGAEDHRGPRLAERRGDVEAAGAGHLDVEQHQIGRQLGDLLRRLHAVFRFADDFDVGMRAQQLLQPLARRLLVVDDQCPNHCQPQPQVPSLQGLHHQHRHVVLILPRAAELRERSSTGAQTSAALRSRQPSINVHQPLPRRTPRRRRRALR